MSIDPISDIIQRLAQDSASEDDWADLFSVLWPYVVGVVYRKLEGDRKPVEDIAQEVFMRLVKYCNFSAFPNARAFLGFVNAVCKNAARDEIRRRRSAPEIDQHSIPDIENIIGSRGPSGAIERGITLAKVFSELDKEDLCLAEYLLEGYSLKEIARLTKRSYGGLAVRFHRLRMKLNASVRGT